MEVEWQYVNLIMLDSIYMCIYCIHQYSRHEISISVQMVAGISTTHNDYIKPDYQIIKNTILIHNSCITSLATTYNYITNVLKFQNKSVNTQTDIHKLPPTLQGEVLKLLDNKLQLLYKWLHSLEGFLGKGKNQSCEAHCSWGVCAVMLSQEIFYFQTL